MAILRSRSLPTRLSVAVFALSFSVASLGALTSYRTASAALRDRVRTQLETDATEEATRVTEWLTRQRTLVDLIADELSRSTAALPQGPDRLVFAPTLSPLLEAEAVEQIRVPGGLIVRSSDSASVGRYAIDDEYYRLAQDGSYLQKIYLSATTGRPRLTIASPIKRGGVTVALIAAHLDLMRLEAVVRHPGSRSLPTDAYLVNRYAEFVSARRFGRDGVRRDIRSEAVTAALARQNGSGIYDDYAGRAVLGAWRWIPDLDLALIVETPQAAALAPARTLLTLTMLLELAATGLLAFGVTAIARRFTAPVLAVADAAAKVAAGDFGVRTPVASDDEVGQLAVAFNVMTARLDSLYARLESQVDATQAALIEAQSSRALLQDLMNNTATLVLVVGLDDVVLLANARVVSLTAVPAHAAVGRSLQELLGPLTSRFSLLIERSRSVDGVVEEEVDIDAPSGRRGWQIVAFPLRREDGSTYATGIIGTDLTERARAEAERRARDASVQQAQKLESLGIMAGGIAHDFNNILSAIIGNVELALDSTGDRDQATAALTRIATSSRRAAELTRQMLAYAGRASLRREVVDARQVIADIMSIVSASRSKKVELTVVPVSEPLWVELDPAQLSQVILNLLTNAAEAIGERRGVVTVSASTNASPQAGDEPREQPAHGWLRLSVEDTGPGIGDDVRARIFDPFFTTKTAGRGLGLSAVRGIMGTLDGVLELSRTGPDGTRFDIFLPRAVPQPVAQGLAVPAVVPSLSGTVLVVDDEASIRDVVSRVVRRLGLTVVEAYDGAHGLEQFRVHAHEISVVVLDLTMPGMGGGEVLKALRVSHPAVPVIIVSGYDRDDALAQIGDDPATRYLAKPFGATALRDQLVEIMHR